MNRRSALCFAAGTFCGGILQGLWQVHRGQAYSPELGFGVAAAGLAVFAFFWALIIFTYAGLTQILRGRDEVNAYASAAVLGLPFWFIVHPLHDFVRDRLGLPDGVWFLEAALVCIVSFEMLRLFQRMLRRRNVGSG